MIIEINNSAQLLDFIENNKKVTLKDKIKIINKYFFD